MKVPALYEMEPIGTNGVLAEQPPELCKFP
jgi:hypothetical protein